MKGKFTKEILEKNSFIIIINKHEKEAYMNFPECIAFITYPDKTQVKISMNIGQIFDDKKFVNSFKSFIKMGNIKPGWKTVEAYGKTFSANILNLE